MKVATLQAEPLSWMRYHYSIRRNDEEITRLRITLFRNRGDFDLDGERFLLNPRGLLGREVEMIRGGSVMARASRPSLLWRRFDVSSAGHHLALESRSWTGRKYVLLLGNQEVGQVTREGWMGKKMEVDFPDDVPVALQVLLVYLVACQAKREAAAASG